MKWKIVIALAGFVIAYYFFDSWGVGRVATVQGAIELNAHVQDVIKPKFYPPVESLGRTPEEHAEFMEREHPNLVD